MKIPPTRNLFNTPLKKNAEGRMQKAEFKPGKTLEAVGDFAVRASLKRGYLYGVAQVSDLLYRRFPIGRASGGSTLHENSDGSQAGSPAIQQVGNLRYFTSGPLNAYERGVDNRKKHALFFAVVSSFFTFHSAFGQGALTPPGAPTPAMKTLTQIEPRTPISSA